jgi:hypothetical protein
MVVYWDQSGLVPVEVDSIWCLHRQDKSHDRTPCMPAHRLDSILPSLAGISCHRNLSGCIQDSQMPAAATRAKSDPAEKGCDADEPSAQLESLCARPPHGSCQGHSSVVMERGSVDSGG